jgi:hypothetical protein
MASIMHVKGSKAFSLPGLKNSRERVLKEIQEFSYSALADALSRKEEGQGNLHCLICRVSQSGPVSMVCRYGPSYLIRSSHTFPSSTTPNVQAASVAPARASTPPHNYQQRILGVVMNLSLYAVNAFIVLDTDGHRVLAKYYTPKGRSQLGDPDPNKGLQNLKEQRAFEKGLFSKTKKPGGASVPFLSVQCIA